ncbi:chorismate lyase [Halomonas sp. McH1-25]|uniref:chorismate--pyruvate lyase family protein n=1 Tax=unclassified Halomonas TaxID=2609666 RepID=UPI001EF66C8B|nr:MULTISPECIES: chorismate lyase [unclassified Halomonas]MCG7599685.1 chorismate lyase [Halomonas sp. McH1-25]MCP1344347.1 chorismate lyase [Halomonas sp. FL8]MCP1362135.1 chorismate lyase [Halomonas sp. BBD45]
MGAESACYTTARRLTREPTVHHHAFISLPSLAWRPAAAWRPAMSPAWWRWVASTDSLTARLVDAASGDFQVRLISQRLVRPRRDEALALNVSPARYVWCREVALCAGRRPWVMARSVAPLDALHGQRMGQLGERSLGSWLFRQPGLQRGPISVTSASPCTLPSLWGRRSEFRHGRLRILVQEFFLARMADELGLPSR